MMLRVWRYAYGGAKVMALKSRLLSPEDYHFLLRARDLTDFLGYLRTTAYGPVLAGWEWQTADDETEFTYRLYGDLAVAFAKVRRGLKKREGRFIVGLGQRLVAENLKVVLRALYQKLPPAQAARRLLPLGNLTRLNFIDLLGQGTIPALVDSLAASPWSKPLNRGLPRYLRENSLFPLEMSLDLWVFELIWQGLPHLSRPDRRIASQLLSTQADITNIIWAVRFREIYGFGGEEIYQYLIAVGRFQEPRQRRDLAFAPGLVEMIALLPRQPYGTLLHGSTSLAAVETRLAQYWIKTLEKVLPRPPFQIGLAITYLFLKELEIHNLITMLTGRLLNLPADRLTPLLHRRTTGGTHV